jgi:hypothetical protein
MFGQPIEMQEHRNDALRLRLRPSDTGLSMATYKRSVGTAILNNAHNLNDVVEGQEWHDMVHWLSV